MKSSVMNIAVVGLTSSSQGDQGEGSGKSCLCNRFMVPHAGECSVFGLLSVVSTPVEWSVKCEVIDTLDGTCSSCLYPSFSLSLSLSLSFPNL